MNPQLCPFCGNEPTVYEGYSGWHVTCFGCECGPGTAGHKRKEAAIRVWNDRKYTIQEIPELDTLAEAAPDLLNLCEEVLSAQFPCDCALNTCSICGPDKLVGRMRQVVAKVKGQPA